MGIKDRLERTVLNWNPRADAPDDQTTNAGVVGGVVVSIEQRVGYEGAVYPAITVTDEDLGADVVIHAFHTTLRQDLDKARVMPGDELAVKYLGRLRAKKGGKAFEAYRLTHERSAANAATAAAGIAAALPDLPGEDPF